MIGLWDTICKAVVTVGFVGSAAIDVKEAGFAV